MKTNAHLIVFAGRLGTAARQVEFRNLRHSARAKILVVCLVALTTLSLSPRVTSAPGGGPVSEQVQQDRSPQAGSQDGRRGTSGAADNHSGRPNAPGIGSGVDSDYRLSPNDSVDIRIEKADELSGVYQINASGMFPMPFLGQVQAQGKTGEELAALIANGLRDRYLVNPNVRVTIIQSAGPSFFIQGAVRAPGKYQVKGRPTLLELITLAGGLADNYGSTAFLLRKIKQPIPPSGASPAADQQSLSGDPEETGAKYEVIKTNINGLLKGNFDNNILVEPEDIVNIPPSDLYFVAGEVKSPGSFPLKDGTTLSHAISLAQGPSSKASTGNCIIRREDPTTGKRHEIKVDFGAIMKGKHEDVALMANDLIVIPSSTAKTIRDAVLGSFGFGMSRVIFR